MHRNGLCLILLLAFSTGCAFVSSTTQDSRTSARETQRLVAQYRSEQQKRLDAINHDYQQASGKVFTEMTRLVNTELYQDFDHEALSLSEKYISSWEVATQPGRVADDLLQTIQADYLKLRKSETNLNQIRVNYARQYENAAAQLNLLQQIEANLAAVSKTKSEWKDLQQTLQIFYDAYQKSHAEPGTEKPKATTGKTAEGTNGK